MVAPVALGALGAQWPLLRPQPQHLPAAYHTPPPGPGPAPAPRRCALQKRLAKEVKDQERLQKLIDKVRVRQPFSLYVIYYLCV